MCLKTLCFNPSILFFSLNKYILRHFLTILKIMPIVSYYFISLKVAYDSKKEIDDPFN